MKRTCLISSSLALLALAPIEAAAEPAILYIPTEEITLLPDNDPMCQALDTPNAAFNCTAAVTEPTVIPPFAGVEDLQAGLATALEPFDVFITNTRPEPYVPYTMLLPEVTSIESLSLACSGSTIFCGARRRNGIVLLYPETQNCTMPDLLHQALYAFGRNSGLEGVANPADVMNFPPDFTTPVAAYLDECSDRSPQLNFDDAGNPTTPAQLECTSKDHVGDCPDDPDGNPGQNSYQDMLAYYGPRAAEDVDAPVLENVVPADGTVLVAGDNGVAALQIDADITDADIAVAARWTITSDALVSDQFPDGVLTICTNDICSVNWGDSIPAKPTGSDWASPVALNFPPGEYAITLEAADYKGNVAEPVSFTVTIDPPPSGTGGEESGNVDETGANDTNEPPPPFTTGQDTGETGDGETDGGSGATDDSGGGCSCRTTQTPGGMVLMLLGLMGLGAMRRRW